MSQFQSLFVRQRVFCRGKHLVTAVIGALIMLRIGAAAPLNSADNRDGASEPLLLARLKQRLGEYRIARDILQRALSKAPHSAALLDQLGSVEQDLGECFEAEQSYLRALSAATSTRSADLERITILHNLATLYLDTNQYSKGERLREQLEMLQSGTLNDHPAEAGALLNVIASLEHERSHDDVAERLYAQSLLLIREAKGPVSVDAALVQANVGFIRLEAREYESAASIFQQAIREIEIVSGPENPALIRPLVNLARCENMRNQPDQAETTARHAVELSTKILGEGHPVTAAAMLEQATALRHLRRKKLARDLEKRAKSCLRNSFTNSPDEDTVSLHELTGTARH